MSFPNHNLGTAKNGPKPSFNLSSSSSDSMAPTNNGFLNHNNTSGRKLDESDNSQPLPGGQQQPAKPVENGGGTSSSGRKSKKHKSKKSKKRRDSKEAALVGWDGAFPNLSSTHSLESNSDVDVTQLPADLKAIGATGLSIFPREEQQQQQQLTSSSSTPPLPPPPLLLSSSSPSSSSTSSSSSAATSTTQSSSSSPFLPDKTAETATTTTIVTTTNNTTTSTTTTTATSATDCTIDNTTSTASFSPKSKQTNNINSNNSSTASVGCSPLAPSEPTSGPEPERDPQPESESETHTDFPNQTHKPQAALALTSSRDKRESRKRPPAERLFSPLEALENEMKRVRKSEPEETSPLSHQMRQRSKSMFYLSPEVVSRVTRSRSICASNGSELEDVKEPKVLPVIPSRKIPDRRRSMAWGGNKLPVTDKYYCLPFKYGWKRELVLRSNASLSRQRGDVIFISPAGKKLRSRDDIIPLLTGELTIDHFCFQRQMQQAGDEFESVRQAQPAMARRKSQAAAKQLQLQQTQQMQQQLKQFSQQQNLQYQQQASGPRAVPPSSGSQGINPPVRPQGVQPPSGPQGVQQASGQQSVHSTSVPQSVQKRTPASGKRVPKPKVPKGASPPSEGWTSTMAVKGNARVLAASNNNSGGAGTGASASQNSRKRGNQSTKSSKIQSAVLPLQPKIQSQLPTAAQAQVQPQPPSQLPLQRQPQLPPVQLYPQPQLQTQPQRPTQAQQAQQVQMQPTSQVQPAAQPQVLGQAQLPAGAQPVQVTGRQLFDNKMICVYCFQSINEKDRAYPVGPVNDRNYICQLCIRPVRKVFHPRPGEEGEEEVDAENQQENEPSNENANANANSNANSNTNASANANGTNFGLKEALYEQNGDSNGSMLGIAEEIELPGELPPDQLLSDDSPIARAGNKITPKPQEIVVINGRKALAIAGEPPRPRLQVIPREPNLEIYEKHYRPKHMRVSSNKEKRQGFKELLSAGIQSCQVMTAVMKTLDFHDRVRMSSVCKTWAMIGRDRSVWRTLKLRNTPINNWMSCMRDMVRNRTHELDMMGAKWSNSKLRMEGDLRVLKSLRVLRTDASEAEFIHAILKRLPRLLELRATCTSRLLNLANIEKMVDLKVLRIRMTDAKANIVSLQPLQKLEHLRELSLRGINNMSQLDLLQLQGFKKLETLILGSCRGMKVAAFGEQVLPNLKHLQHLRLENHPSNRSFYITEIMKGLAAANGGGTVKRLELINVNVDERFSRQLGKCKSVGELLLMPNFHNNTANMMHYVMQAINENSEQLKVFRLGITFELLSVTRALAMNHEKDCIPVALPIPGVSRNDKLNQSDETIAYLPVDRLESILHHMMPQAWLTVAKVSQSETTNLKFLLASPKKDAAGGGAVVAAAAGGGGTGAGGTKNKIT